MVLIGTCIDRIERVIRQHRFSRLRLMGMTGPVLLCFIVGIVIFGLTSIPTLGIIFAIYFAYAGLALKGLLEEARNVEAHIVSNDLPAARRSLSMLVSRDTSEMDVPDLRRSLAETVSENYSDGFFAPFFFLALFGPVGLWVYKTINTFDSMWGYKNDRYEKLGWFAAKLDDVFNWLPARLSILSLFIAGKTLGLQEQGVLSKTRLQAPAMESPNAGWPMAACAWLAGGSMGGTTIYFGEAKKKPLLGPEGQEWTSEKMENLLHLIHRAGWLTALILTGMMFFLALA